MNILSRFHRLRALDQWLLLRHPRLWQTRAHVVLPLAACAYVLLAAVLLLGVRPLLTPDITALMRGESVFYGAISRSTPDQLRNSIVLSLARQTRADALGTTVFLICLALFVIGIAASVFWLRTQGRHSVERVSGARSLRAIAAEWLLCVVCSAVFAGLPVWGFAMLSPSPAQRAAREQIHQLTRDTVIQYTQRKNINPNDMFQTGYLGPRQLPEQTVNYYYFNEQVLGTAYYGGPQNLIAPDSLVFTINTAKVKSTTYGPEWLRWEIAPGMSPEAARYVDTLTRSTYAYAFRQDSVPGILVDLIYGGVLFWWITGLAAFMVFTARRAPVRYVVAAALILIVLLPLLTLIATLIFTSLIALTGNPAFAAASTWAPIGLIYAIYAVLVLFSLVALIKAHVGARFRRRWLAGVIAGPFLIAYLPFLFVLSVPLFTFSLYSGTGPSERALAFNAWVGENLHYILAIAPFLYAPFLPIYERALARLGAMPR